MLSCKCTQWPRIFFLSSILVAFIFPSQSTYGQGGISAEITYPTKNYDCTNGFIDLTIDDAYPPYTVACLVVKFMLRTEYQIKSLIVL